MFGAAILRDDPNLTTVVADSNHEMLCPLYHGEIWTIKQWSELPPEKKPPASECVFLCTHEPCCLCISGIVWSGFKKSYFLYSYETTKDQGIPHDINILHELWQVPTYAMCNKFTSSCSIYKSIDQCSEKDKAELLDMAKEIQTEYEALANKYHEEKAANPDNNLAFN
mmetsp:Transcript_42643/g.76686  ORF Transcript_42643/g.76686 Transcript_42643/m.76686 type:complete len:168 (-) Transcript_42643:216-719(-)